MSVSKPSTTAIQRSVIVSIGEPAGIGPDIIVKAWNDRNRLGLPHFTILGDCALLQARADELGVPVATQQVETGSQAFNCKEQLPVISLQNPLTGHPGKPDKGNSRGIIEAIARGVELVLTGEFCSLTTSPINKKVLYDAGFDFPGHTEFLADLAAKHLGAPVTPVMLLAGPQLRAVPVTIHIPLHQVKHALTAELILQTARTTAQEMKDKFGLEHPILAFSGLNPHAGEEGAMGNEEIEIITPCVDILRKEGINVVGPLPADTMFHARARAQYDVAICMYHDQALIPAKTLGFDDSVNVTLGLPFIRTSPDHGTAFEIAGSGEAKVDSFAAALIMAADMASKQAEQNG